jgi:O-acetyl-ADP-ribose deacetylase (regulator of RNase III)
VRRSARAAMRAGLEQAFASIAFPGMGTGTGRLPFDAAAKAMFDGMEEALFSPR